MSKKQLHLPLVSVVITTKNEAHNIRNCLESIREQTYPQEKIEIIVVDNNSTDRTKEIAQKYTKKVYNKGPERSAQRNYGMMEKARGKYVMYLDADMILSATVIEKAVQKLEALNSSPQASGLKQELVALYIPEIVLGNSFWSRVRRFERSFYDGTAIDCVRIIRRDIFIKSGGFDLSLTGPEDWDLDKKIRSLGKTAVLCRYSLEKMNRKIGDIKHGKLSTRELKKLVNLTPKPIIFHNEAEFNLKKYLQKKAYYAQSFDKYIRKWGKDDSDVKKQFSLWYRYFGVFLEKGKWKRILKHPILTAGMYFLRFMVGWQYLLRSNASLRHKAKTPQRG